MKVEVDVSKDSLIIGIDGVEIDVYNDLSKEMVEDSIKKSIWLASIAYEVNRRLHRFVEIEKRSYMTHWREWAIKWTKVKGMKDTMDIIDSAVSKLFGDSSIKEKIQNVFDVRGMVKKDVDRFETWGKFFNDDDVSDVIKDHCRAMYRMELEKNMTYDKMVDLESRMTTIVSSLKIAADGYKRKSEQEKSLKF